MTELVKGFNSGEEEHWLTEEEVDRHFSDKKAQKEGRIGLRDSKKEGHNGSRTSAVKEN